MIFSEKTDRKLGDLLGLIYFIIIAKLIIILFAVTFFGSMIYSNYKYAKEQIQIEQQQNKPVYSNNYYR